MSKYVHSRPEQCTYRGIDVDDDAVGDDGEATDGIAGAYAMAEDAAGGRCVGKCR